jgi:hypothetical protein
MGGDMHAGAMGGGMHVGGMGGGMRFGAMSGATHFSGSRFASAPFAHAGFQGSRSGTGTVSVIASIILVKPFSFVELRIPGNVAAARLESSFRSLDEYYRRLCRARPSQSRRTAGLSSDPYGSRYRVLSPCSQLIAIATFGVIVSAIFSYVYLSTSSYVRSRWIVRS